MADRRGTKHNPHSRKVMTHLRQRAVGFTGAISMFLTLGLGPLANAPKATADEFDVVIDQVLNAITASLGDVAAGSAAVPELVDGRKVRDQRQMHYEMLPHARPGGIAGLLEIVIDLSNQSTGRASERNAGHGKA